MRKRKKIEIQNTQRPISDMLKYWIRRSVLHFFGRNGGNVSTYFGNFSVSQKTDLSRNRDKKFYRVFAVVALVATIITIFSNGKTHDGVLSLIILMIAIALILLPFSTRFFAVLSFFNSIQSDLRLLGNADLITIDAMSGREFETYCGILYESIGYKVEVTQQSQDQGADIVLVGHNGRTVIQTKPIMSPIYRRVSL
jgi:hypothetical protein